MTTKAFEPNIFARNGIQGVINKVVLRSIGKNVRGQAVSQIERPKFISLQILSTINLQAKLPLKSSTIKQRYLMNLFRVNWHVILFAIDVLN